MTEYRIIATDKTGDRSDDWVFTRKSQAIKIAKKLIKEGYKEVYIDIYKPSTNFIGEPDYSDIVWTDYITENKIKTL
jgi:hypothetical protein